MSTSRYTLTSLSATAPLVQLISTECTEWPQLRHNSIRNQMNDCFSQSCSHLLLEAAHNAMFGLFYTACICSGPHINRLWIHTAVPTEIEKCTEDYFHYGIIADIAVYNSSPMHRLTITSCITSYWLNHDSKTSEA